MTNEQWFVRETYLPEYVIVKMSMEHGEEYKIAFKSRVHVDECITYRMLADTYALGTELPYGPYVVNSFKTYEEAKKALSDLKGGRNE